MPEPVEGLSGATAMFDAMPDAVREQLGVEIAIIARDVLALQQVRAPRDTGALEAGLGIQLLLDQLRARIGLVNTKAGRSKLFYGRIIEFGRAAQVVLRRLPGSGSSKSKRRKRLDEFAVTGPLKVKARAPQPFVLVPEPDLDAAADRRLATFWEQVIAKVGVS